MSVNDNLKVIIGGVLCRLTQRFYQRTYTTFVNTIFGFLETKQSRSIRIVQICDQRKQAKRTVRNYTRTEPDAINHLNFERVLLLIY